MNFLEILDKGTDVLRRIYKDDNIFKFENFHIDNIRLDKSAINFRLFLPMPQNPSTKLINQGKNIATMGIDILIDGNLKIEKYYTHGKDELEIFNIEVEKIDKKRYSIIMNSNDNTCIYIETSFVSAGLGFGFVENWFLKEIECKTY